ncbi:MAG: efflux RND transporter permease subunit [Bacteroidia bacterium]|nr:efflux RND transporter permease subunit [Bacteroidia bacterium]
MIDKFKEFKPSSWAINNRTSIYIITIIITLAGILSYMSIPKEQFPDIKIATIYVTTFNYGTSPTDVENLITKPLEKQIKGIAGIKKMTSNSVQDFSNIMIEFNTDVSEADAKQKVKDKVDLARKDLPNDLSDEPNVIAVDFSEFPMLSVNIAGDYDLDKLKSYADDIKDKIEAMREIRRVDMVGDLEREIQINVDMYKMQAAQISMRDIENAVRFENMTISGGNVKMDGMERSLSVKGEFKNVDQINNLVVNSTAGSPIYLRDVATVVDAHKEQESYARLYGKNVITLNVIRSTGENLVEASDKITAMLNEMKTTTLPKDVEVSVTGDQSTSTKVTLHDLINTIIIGFILVTIVLMFFMGATNALFVAMSVPLSMFVAFLVLPAIGFSLNMIVLFAFLLALGIVVDDAIVVIENTHRIFENGKVPIVQAAKMATGEVFLPVLSGTLTTLAPFIPLAFWSGLIGKFMVFLPVTLIITLLASLLVAYIINPVFAVDFMKPHNDAEHKKPLKQKSFKVTATIFGVIAAISYLIAFTSHSAGAFGMGNFAVFIILLVVFFRLFLEKRILHFQKVTWPAVQSKYESILRWALARPYTMIFSTVALFFLSIVFLIIRQPQVIFFPQADPNFVYVYVTLPVGTDVAYTDSITRIAEERVYKVLGPNNKIVTSVISSVAINASDPAEGDRGTYSHKSRIMIAFVEYAKRNGESTAPYLTKIRNELKGIAGAEITVDKEQSGPPTQKPINVEIACDDFDKLVATSIAMKNYLDSSAIPGVEQLKSNLQNKKPEIVFDIDRERANRQGISTAQIGTEIRNAVFGAEVSKFRDDDDEYPIQLRYIKEQRNNIDELNNIKVTYRDMNMGGIVRQVPLSAFTNIHYSNTFGGITRKNQTRTVTISSNVLSNYNPNETVAKVESAVNRFKLPDGVTVKMTGEQEEQAETGAFLGRALLISLGMIFLILVTQFNSFSKPLIILTEIIFSVIGVFLGNAIFGMDFSVIMSGIGIVALAGIVVRNGILIVEFTDLLREQGLELFEAIIEAGKTRLTPVLLTATATMLGLVPLAVGLNIDFVTLFTELNPHLFFGGDSVAFWGPLSWTMIFGLGFATFITLVLVPAMYLISERIKLKRKAKKATAIA